MPMLALPRTAQRALVSGAGAGLALLAALAIVLFVWDRVVPDARQAIAHGAEDEAAELAAARAAILARAPDADSITLGRAVVVGFGTTPAVCGRVDIEAPDDSLDGPERFVFVDGELTLESADGSAAVDSRWKDVCAGV